MHREGIRKLRITFLCVGLVSLLGISIYSAHVLLTRPSYLKKENAKISEDAFISVNAPAPAMPVIDIHGLRKATLPNQYATPTTHSSAPLATPMTSTSMRLRVTSDATVKQIGGGYNTRNWAYAANNQSRGIQSAFAYSGAIYLQTTHNAITEVGASSANSSASLVTPEKHAAPSVNKIIDHPEEWWLTPLGDVTWGWLILLAVGYMLCRYRRRTHA